MPSSFELFKKQLDDAVDMIEQTHVFDNAPLNLPQTVDELVDTQSLLARCDHVAEKYEASKPVIRIIHHLACSGGTLISKCISAMPNVYLLSEVHPFAFPANILNGKPQFAPTNIPLLSAYAGIPEIDDLLKNLFRASIREVCSHVERFGGCLVLRDHTHSDYCVGESTVGELSMHSLLEEEYKIKKILTIRNPIDSYASLHKNGWVRFNPATFDEYCKRFLELAGQFEDESIIKYEDFVEEPQTLMKEICLKVDLSYSDFFEDLFFAEKVTGDSGRTSEEIENKPRRLLSDSFILEINESENFKKVSQKFGYK